jgi:hypothetical protein
MEMKMNKQKDQNQPAHEIRLGRIRATVWANETESGTRHNVTFSRLYKDASGAWKDSTSFGRDDLPLVAKVADAAHSWIFEEQSENHQQEEADDEEPPRRASSIFARRRR